MAFVVELNLHIVYKMLYWQEKISKILKYGAINQ